MLWAISLGRDTDTNAAVAGALLGARHGLELVPAVRSSSQTSVAVIWFSSGTTDSMERKRVSSSIRFGGR